jgi:ATP-binding cassette subfamily B protein
MEAKAQAAGAIALPPADPKTLPALLDLVRLVGRSQAPQLRLRLTLAVLLTIVGKALGVLAPLVLGAAVNHLAADQPAGVAVGLGFAGFAVGWAVVRFRHPNCRTWFSRPSARRRSGVLQPRLSPMR